MAINVLCRSANGVHIDLVGEITSDLKSSAGANTRIFQKCLLFPAVLEAIDPREAVAHSARVPAYKQRIRKVHDRPVKYVRVDVLAIS